MSHDDERTRGNADNAADNAAGIDAVIDTENDPDTAPDDADGYRPDPDAPPTVEGRVAQAAGELSKLLRASFVATCAIGALVAVAEVVLGKAGFPTTWGYLVGAGLATVNLWLLGGGFFAIMRGEAATLRALLAFGGSFIAMVLFALFVVMARREWTLGFALGLATPAVAGVLYGRSLDDADS